MRPFESPPAPEAGETHAATSSPIDARLEHWLRGYHLPLFLAVAAAALVVAWLLRFVQDDAFISFIYARNLVRGEGLTWFGARAEGYTNLLWVLWMAAGMRLGVEPIAWSWAGGLLSLALGLLAFWRLALDLFGRVLPALLALLILVTNFSVLSYGTGGLETMLQTALLAWAALVAARLSRSPEHDIGRALALSLLLAGSAMTRPDSLLPGAILAGWALAGMARRRAGWRAYVALALPFGLLIGGWAAWKLAYYGRLLPVTFYAKTGVTPAMLANGVRFVFRFLHWYLLWPFLAAGLVALAVRRREADARLLPVAIVVASWFGYVILIGGDFMEFRLMVPVMPFLSLLLASLVCDAIGAAIGRRPALAALATVVVLGCASVIHARSFRGLTPDKALDSVHSLSTFYGLYPTRDWREVGDALRTQLAGTDPLLALDAVGAIPFYSGLRTVDQLGLTDPEVAAHGNRAQAFYRRPGHQRHASLRYLRERGVNFIIGQPTLVPLDLLERAEVGQFLSSWVPAAVEFEVEPISRVSLVLLPVRPGLGLVMWYLTPKLEIDAVIAARRWPRATWRVDHGADATPSTTGGG